MARPQFSRRSTLMAPDVKRVFSFMGRPSREERALNRWLSANPERLQRPRGPRDPRLLPQWISCPGTDPECRWAWVIPEDHRFDWLDHPGSVEAWLRDLHHHIPNCPLKEVSS